MCVKRVTYGSPRGDTYRVEAMGACDTSVIERNVALGNRHRVTGTPAVVFEDGSRTPGAIPADQLESRLVAAAKR